MGKVDFSIGDFDTRICLYRQETTRTEAGAVVKDFVEDKEVFACISPKTLDETAGGEQIRVIEVLEITTYLLPAMNNAWRVGIGEDTYEVISVEPVKRRFMKVVIKRL